ncbi:hypothetical protein ACQ4LE_006847 [Meloidogyne hapla]
MTCNTKRHISCFGTQYCPRQSIAQLGVSGNNLEPYRRVFFLLFLRARCLLQYIQNSMLMQYMALVIKNILNLCTLLLMELSKNLTFTDLNFLEFCTRRIIPSDYNRQPFLVAFRKFYLQFLILFNFKGKYIPEIFWNF